MGFWSTFLPEGCLNVQLTNLLYKTDVYLSSYSKISLSTVG